jgi:hypothetical protein
MTKCKTDIRVNLRFGIRSDPWIVEKLASLAPQERARWVRTWILDGTRALRGTGPEIPKASMPEAARPEKEGPTKEGMFTLVGKSIL